ELLTWDKSTVAEFISKNYVWLFAADQNKIPVIVRILISNRNKLLKSRKFTPKNKITLYCEAHYLDMTHYYDVNNLLHMAKYFLYGHILHNRKKCIMTLQSCETQIHRA
ncbi:phototropic-responsive NPH3 family protein, partial [Striga asiatica]